MFRIFDERIAPSKIGPVVLSQATSSHMTMIEHFQRTHTESLGFIPTAAMNHRMSLGDYLKVTANGQDAGFLLVSAGTRKPVRIAQILVTDELWRQGVGTACIQMIRQYAAGMRCPSVVGAGAEGLPIHEVARVTGANQVQVVTPSNKRKRKIIHWCWGPIPQQNLQQ